MRRESGTYALVRPSPYGRCDLDVLVGRVQRIALMTGQTLEVRGNRGCVVEVESVLRHRRARRLPVGQDSGVQEPGSLRLRKLWQPRDSGCLSLYDRRKGRVEKIEPLTLQVLAVTVGALSGGYDL